MISRAMRVSLSRARRMGRKSKLWSRQRRTCLREEGQGQNVHIVLADVRRQMISRAMRVSLSRARQGWTSQTKRTGLAWKEGASQIWWRELELRERLSELPHQREQFLWPEPCQQSQFLKRCKISGQKRIGLMSAAHSVNANTIHTQRKLMENNM